MFSVYIICVRSAEIIINCPESINACDHFGCMYMRCWFSVFSKRTEYKYIAMNKFYHSKNYNTHNNARAWRHDGYLLIPKIWLSSVPQTLPKNTCMHYTRGMCSAEQVTYTPFLIFSHFARYCSHSCVPLLLYLNLNWKKNVRQWMRNQRKKEKYEILIGYKIQVALFSYIPFHYWYCTDSNTATYQRSLAE